jgi:hypothetical protein
VSFRASTYLGLSFPDVTFVAAATMASISTILFVAGRGHHFNINPWLGDEQRQNGVKLEFKTVKQDFVLKHYDIIDLHDH